MSAELARYRTIRRSADKKKKKDILTFCSTFVRPTIAGCREPARHWPRPVEASALTRAASPNAQTLTWSSSRERCTTRAKHYRDQLRSGVHLIDRRLCWLRYRPVGAKSLPCSKPGGTFFIRDDRDVHDNRGGYFSTALGLRQPYFEAGCSDDMG